MVAKKLSVDVLLGKIFMHEHSTMYVWVRRRSVVMTDGTTEQIECKPNNGNFTTTSRAEDEYCVPSALESNYTRDTKA